MLLMIALVTIVGSPSLAAPARPAAESADVSRRCVECHATATPGIVGDWKASKHASAGIGCDACHGDEHVDGTDIPRAKIPTPDTCGTCHPERLAQFTAGKHAKAWAAMQAMPTIHMQPMAMREGLKGCGGCHKIGLKSEEEIRALRHDGNMFGVASCDSCHTRHTFSVAEARSPEACRTCHMGFDHAQWEMYESSKHGVRHALIAQRVLPDTAAAPTCQTCHMPKGSHEVRTAWGFLGIRLPLPADVGRAADVTLIAQALGVLDPSGKPTARLELVKQADVARLTGPAFDRERTRMLDACATCHASNFARAEMDKTDQLIADADHVMAEAIRIVADLYRDGILAKPKTYAGAFPDLLTFHDAPTVVEQKLFVMFLDHRMRTFQGSFHNSPDYALWYGWSEMKRDLTEIKELAAEMRDRGRRGARPKP